MPSAAGGSAPKAAQPIDASGALPDGTKFDGPAELRAAAGRRPEQFVTVVTEKLLIYALGRGIEYYDAPRFDASCAAPRRASYSVADLIVGLVNSTPFQMRSRAGRPETTGRRQPQPLAEADCAVPIVDV